MIYCRFIFILVFILLNFETTLLHRRAVAEERQNPHVAVLSEKRTAKYKVKEWSQILMPMGLRSVPKEFAKALSLLADGSYEEAARTAESFASRKVVAGGVRSDINVWVFNARLVSARAHLESERPLETLRVLKKIDLDKRSIPRVLRPYLLFLEAQALEALGRNSAAAQKFESIQVAGVLARTVRASTARAWFAAEDCGRGGYATEVLRTHHPRHPNLPKLLYQKARCSEVESRFSESVLNYHEIWVRYPLDSAALAAEKRLTHLRKKGFKSPQSSTRELLARAMMLQKARKIDEALRAWQVLKIRKLSKSVRLRAGFYMGLDSYFLRRNRKAAEYLRWTASNGRGGRWAPKALYYLARTHLRRGNSKDFQKVGDELLRDYPRNGWARQFLYLQARVIEDNGHLERAFRLYEKLASNHPATGQGDLAQWRIGWIYFRNRRYTQAEQSFSRLARVRAHRPVAQAARYWAGRSAEQAGLLNAKFYYRSARDVDPTSYYGQLGALRLGITLKRNARKNAGFQFFVKPPTWQGESKFKAEEASHFFLAGFFRAAADIIQKSSLDSRYFLYQRARLLYMARNHREALQILEKPTFRRFRLSMGSTSQEFWRILYPLDRRSLRHAEKKGASGFVDPLLISAITRAESLFDPKGISTAGARGLMQLMPQTARLVARRLNLPQPSPEDLFSPGLNVRLGSALLRDLLVRFGGNPVPAVAAYNAGFDVTQKWWKANGHLDEASFISLIPYRETRRYTRRVMSYYRWYQVIYGENPLKSPNQGGGRDKP